VEELLKSLSFRDPSCIPWFVWRGSPGTHPGRAKNMTAKTFTTISLGECYLACLFGHPFGILQTFPEGESDA
jgi:hypothetical protein